MRKSRLLKGRFHQVSGFQIGTPRMPFYAHRRDIDEQGSEGFFPEHRDHLFVDAEINLIVGRLNLSHFPFGGANKTADDGGLNPVDFFVQLAHGANDCSVTIHHAEFFGGLQS